MSDPELPLTDSKPPADAQPPAPPKTIDVPEGLFRRVEVLRSEMQAKTAEYNTSAEETKAAKKNLDLATNAFVRAWDDLDRAQKGEDLPLFNQGDALAAATARPEVQNLVDELNLENDADGMKHIRWDPQVIAGYTEAERKQAYAWIADNRDARKKVDDLRAEGKNDEAHSVEFPELPPFMDKAPGAVDEHGTRPAITD